MLRLCSYNIEWFDDHFNDDNTLKTGGEHDARFDAVVSVLEMLDPDVVGIVEAPNTTTTTGIQSTVEKLQNFAAAKGLRQSTAMIGFPSAGRQELAFLYDPAKATLTHRPGGSPGTRGNPPFDEEFFYDSDEDRIKEVYKHYRPPLEAEIGLPGGETFMAMLVHAKSKGIFNAVDLVHWERENVRNRHKLFAECWSIRNRIDEWFDDGLPMVVMGDVNDGPGMDFYERRFSRSAAEILMGTIYEPDRLLRTQIGAPRWGRYGWEPSSARFRDRFTEDYVNVLIDQILYSGDLPAVAGSQKVWNPYQLDEARPHRADLLAASDHFPLTIDVELG